MAPNSPAWLSRVIDAAPVALTVVDSDDRIVLANRAMEELLGQEPGALLGERLDQVQQAAGPLYGARAGQGPVITSSWTETQWDGLCYRIGSFAPPSGIADATARQQVEELRQRMIALVESADDAILTKTLDGILTGWNPAAVRMLGYTPAEILGQPVTRLIPADRQHEEASILAQIRRGEHVAHFETVRQRKDGTLVDVSLTISPIRDAQGRVVGASKIMRDISERRQAMHDLAALNSALEHQVEARTAQLKERETLIQEIHHRVKNNLQVISSLIMMQARSVEDAAVQTALRECRSRVATMADIHEMLYQSYDYARVPFGKFVRDLASRVSSASGLSPGAVALRFDVDAVDIPVDRAIPCGLILNELLANSMKHAFPEGRQGCIEIALRQPAADRVVLSIRDDGIGSAGEDYSASATIVPAKSLGMQLVRTLASQLQADIRRSGPPGTRYDIAFSTETRG